MMPAGAHSVCVLSACSDDRLRLVCKEAWDVFVNEPVPYWVGGRW